MAVPVPDHTGNYAAPGNARHSHAQRAATPSLEVVGSNNAPTILPDQMIVVDPSFIGYADLFTSLDANGAPVRARWGGTFVPPTTGALKLGG